MKKKTKTLVILAVCAVVLIAAALVTAVVVSKTYVPGAKEYAAQFDAARTDYDDAAAFIKTLTKKDPTAPVTVSIPTVGEDDTIYFFRDNSKERVVTLTVKPEQRAALDGVARAFSRCGFEFKSARTEKGNVTFTDVEGAYRVLYVADDEAPENDGALRVKKFDACWYQMIRVEK